MELPSALTAARPVRGETSNRLWFRLGLAVASSLLLVAAGLGRPATLIWFAVLLLPVGAALFVAFRPSLSFTLPFLGLLFLTPQIGPGIYLFDFLAVVLAAAALWVTFTRDNRQAWEVHTPGYLSLAALVIPLLSVPGVVVSMFSFVGVYKQLVIEVILFHSLRRLVRIEQSLRLLWVFPITGLVASIQLLLKVRGFGFKVYSDLEYRNYFTSLGWGESNYIAALLVVCIGGTFVLGLLDRRRWLHLALAAAGAFMLAAFTILLSRAATIALAAFALTLLVCWGGKRSIAAAGALVALVGLLFVTPGGQVILARFTNPREYASWYTRTLLWENAWSRFLGHPWTGIGLNQGRYQADRMGGAEAHNLLLEHLMDQGILGAILLIAIAIAAYKLCASSRIPGPLERQKLVRGALLAMVTAVFVNASVEPTLDGYVVGGLFVWFLAWLVMQNAPKALNPSV